jgi:hypothetical protein
MQKQNGSSSFASKAFCSKAKTMRHNEACISCMASHETPWNLWTGRVEMGRPNVASTSHKGNGSQEYKGTEAPITLKSDSNQGNLSDLGSSGHFPRFSAPFQLLFYIPHRIHGAAIYGNIYHQYTPNVSIYTSTMDPRGTGSFADFRVDCWIKKPRMRASPASCEVITRLKSRRDPGLAFTLGFRGFAGRQSQVPIRSLGHPSAKRPNAIHTLTWCQIIPKC